MLSQIIFFAAVALLIILLLRRATMAKDSIKAIGSSSRHIGDSLLKAGRWLLSVTSRLWQRRNTPQTSPKNRFAPAPISPSKYDHKFWQEAPLVDKLALDSDFEEGELLYKAGKYTEAEQYFLKAAANHPADAKIYARLGLLYLQQKNYSDAIEALKVAVKLDKYNPSRQYNLSLAYWGNKDVQRAISSVREAITLDPVTQKYRQLLEQLLNS